MAALCRWMARAATRTLALPSFGLARLAYSAGAAPRGATTNPKDRNTMKQAKALARAAGLALPLSLAAALAHANCGSAMCLLNTDWSTQGVWTEPGLRADLRYEGVRQDRLRAGTKKVGPEAVSDEIVPLETRDGNWFVGLDYAFDARWGLGVSLPVVRREHRQLLRDELAGDSVQDFSLDGAGDVRVLGRYQALSSVSLDRGAEAAGLTFGLKLPTGRDDVLDPNGERAEPGLQPGTGTTDLLLGAYWHRQLVDSRLSLFARVQWQRALDRKDDYRPGDKLSLDVGLRYPLTDRLALQLQANALATAKSEGERAEPENTGGTLVTLSPGIAFGLTNDTQLYAFYQRPLYQRVNGVQLSTKDAFALGISTRF
jgi:outer membrane receptor protein involved in Fe transport